MAFRLAPWALILLLLNSVVIIVNAATANPPTSVRFFTDSNCKSLFATVQTAANVGNGQCGILPAGISSASSVFLDDGCYDACSDGATAVRLGDCTALSARAFSIDCPGINGTYDPGYTTSTAESVPSSTFETPRVVQSTNEAKSSVAALGSTTVPELLSGPVTTNVNPSPAHDPSSTPSSFTTSSTSTPPTLSPPSQSSTTSPLTPKSPTSPLTPKSPTSPSPSRNFQTSLQPSSSSSSSASSPSPSPPSTQGQQGTGNNGSLSGYTKLILEVVLPTVGILGTVVAVAICIRRTNHRKKAPTLREESENSSSNPVPDLLHYLGQPKAELEVGHKGENELDDSPKEGISGHHELGSRELYEMEDGRVEKMGVNKEMGIQELNGEGAHAR